MLLMLTMQNKRNIENVEENGNKVVLYVGCFSINWHNHLTGVMCHHIQHRHVDVNLQGEQAAGARSPSQML